jgi:hypothetical protein
LNYFKSLVGSLPHDFLRNSSNTSKATVVRAKIENAGSDVADLIVQNDFLNNMAKLLDSGDPFTWEGTEFKKIEEKID